MAYVTRYFDDGTGLLRIGSGIVTAEEIVAESRKLQADPERARKITHALVDFTEVTELRISLEEARQVAETSKQLARVAPGCVVSVAAPSDHVFGVARQWESLVDEEAGWVTRVFRTRPEAEAWLRAQLRTGPRPETAGGR